MHPKVKLKVINIPDRFGTIFEAVNPTELRKHDITSCYVITMARETLNSELNIIGALDRKLFTDAPPPSPLAPKTKNLNYFKLSKLPRNL